MVLDMAYNTAITIAEFNQVSSAVSIKYIDDVVHVKLLNRLLLRVVDTQRLFVHSDCYGHLSRHYQCEIELFSSTD